MKRGSRIPGGQLEDAILGSLWNRGAASAREIHDEIGSPRGLVYTTIAKVLDRLHAKGLVSRRRVGRAFTYTSCVPRQVVERARAAHMLRRILGPQPEPAIATLVEAIEDIDPALMDELSRQVAARRRSRRGS